MEYIPDNNPMLRHSRDGRDEEKNKVRGIVRTMQTKWTRNTNPVVRNPVTGEWCRYK